MSFSEDCFSQCGRAGAASIFTQERLRGIQGGFLFGIILVSAIPYSFRFASFLHVKEITLGIGLILLGVLCAVRRTSIRPGFQWFLPLWIGLFVMGVVGVFSSHLWFRVLEECARCAMILLVAALSWEFCQDVVWGRRLQTAIILTAGIISCLALLQYFGFAFCLFPCFEHYDQRMYSVFGNQDLLGGYVAVAVVLLLRRMFQAARSPFLFLPPLTLLATTLVLSGSRSAWLAAALGGAYVFPWQAASYRMLRGHAMALFLLAVILLWTSGSGTFQRVTQTWGPEDVGGRARLWFWDGTLRMARDAPWFGVGLGNYAYWSPRYLGEALAAPGGNRHYRNEILTEYAHSEPLEYLAETGAAGSFFMLWMLFRVMLRSGESKGGLIAILVFAVFNPAFHSAPHALAVVLLAAMMKPPVRETQEASGFLQSASGSWRAGGASALAALGLFVGMCWMVYWPGFLLRNAEDVHLASPAQSLSHYERALAHPWPAPDAREEYGMALLDTGAPLAAYRQFMLALQGLDSGRLYLLLGIAAEKLGDRSAACDWLDQCLLRWPDNSQAKALREMLLAEIRNQQS